MTMKTNRDEIPWAPAFPFDQVLSLPFPDPLLGDGLSSKHLAAQLVVLLLHRDLVPHTSHLQLQQNIYIFTVECSVYFYTFCSSGKIWFGESCQFAMRRYRL